jgi:PAS domain S-box-containing protein
MTGTMAKVLRDTDISPRVLQALMAASYDSILITDATRAARIIYANNAFKTLTGYAPSEVIGETPRILQGPGTDKKVIARLGKALKKGGKFQGRAINYRKDGTPFIMDWRVMPVKTTRQTKLWIAIQRNAGDCASAAARSISAWCSLAKTSACAKSPTTSGWSASCTTTSASSTTRNAA